MTTGIHSEARAAPADAPRVRVLDSNRATLELLQEWLRVAGYRIAGEAEAAATALVIVDVPFARHGALEHVQRVAQQFPGAKILALSSTFFPTVRCQGACAHALGVAGVLPKPVARQALLDAVRGLIESQP